MSKKRVRRSREYWEDQVVKWRSSGKTQKEYCKKSGISLWSLRNWSRDFPKGPSVKREVTSKKFVEVNLSDGPQSLSPDFELKMVSGDILRFSVDSDVKQVSLLVQALREVRC